MGTWRTENWEYGHKCAIFLNDVFTVNPVGNQENTPVPAQNSGLLINSALLTDLQDQVSKGLRNGA